MKNIFKYIILITVTTGIFSACAPQDADNYSLGGSLAAMPNEWKVTAVDNDNTVEIKFDPCTIIDGNNILGVQFSCIEADINFVVKDVTQTEYTKKIYTSGHYTLYVAPVTRAGAGVPLEVSFTVANNLLLTTLSRTTLSEETQSSGETFYYSGLYIEKNSIIALTDEMADDDMVYSLDYFKRNSTAEVQFLGESGIYNIYYSPTRKIVLIAVDNPDFPAYLICIGKGFAYPGKIAPYYVPNYPQWGMASDLLGYILYRKIADNTFQTTAMMKSGSDNLEFKAYHAYGGGRLTNDWANGGEYKYSDCTFSGIPIFQPAGDGNNWNASETLDEAKLYRVTVTVTTQATNANVKVEEVDWNGNVIPYEEKPQEPVNPDEPIVSSSINPTSAKITELDGETVLDIYQTLAKDAEYTPQGAITNALFNVDFFEKTDGKVKFLGADGDYHLIFNQTRNNVIVVAADPKQPDYMLIAGVGLGYPTRTPGSVISTVYPGKGISTLDNWGFANDYEYILMNKTGDNIYQATVMIPFDGRFWWDAGPYVSFKFYTQKNADAENEISGKAIIDGGGFSGNASQIVPLFSNVGDDGNIGIFTELPLATVRITLNMDTKSVTVNNFTLP